MLLSPSSSEKVSKIRVKNREPVPSYRMDRNDDEIGAMMVSAAFARLPLSLSITRPARNSIAKASKSVPSAARSELAVKRSIVERVCGAIDACLAFRNPINHPRSAARGREKADLARPGADVVTGHCQFFMKRLSPIPRL